MNDRAVRVRFAPSPTGYLHVGGARTALFNWLFARHHRGVFVLRVEDTDVKRFAQEYEAAIFDALHWLGLDWDEGPDVGGPHEPYMQSRRAASYADVAAQLAASGAAYACYCGPSAADTDGDGPSKALCHCAGLTGAALEAARTSKPAPALRLSVDKSRPLIVRDLIRGEVTFPAGSLEDFVIVKSGGGPLYNFAAVVDDHDMEITHVIRGDEHLANTPKQLLIYEALGWSAPQFAHIPIILNERRAKLSKRDGAVFVTDYERMGILPQAMFNFLALLGWSPGENRELLTRDELIAEFDLDRVVKHPAVFDVAKLRWMNGEYMRTASVSEIAAAARRLPAGADVSNERLNGVAALLKDRVRTVAELLEQGAYLLQDRGIEPAADALAKYCAAPDTAELLTQTREALARIDDFTHEQIERAIRAFAEGSGRKAGAYIHPLRVALTGQAVSPGIFEVARVLGKDVVLRRIDDLIAQLRRGRVGAEEAKT